MYLFSNQTFALGLGDVELKSHLNEALSLRINISDTDPEPDANCFTATDASEATAFKKAYITYKKTNGINQLSIISYDIITEPIVNLLVTYHCDPQIKREYVLLMDPAPTPGPEVAPITEKTVNTEKLTPSKPKIKRNASKLEGAQTYASANNVDLETFVEKPKKKRKKTRAVTVDEKLAEAYTGKTVTESKPSTASPRQTKETNNTANPNTDKPFLVISGGSTDNGAQPNLALRMDRKIDFARTDSAPVINNTDVADEMTVMTNRLAHLEKQILSLQTKNTQLLAENEKVKNEGFRVSPEVYEWLQRFLIGLGIIALLAAAEFLRRKIMLKRLHQDEAVWFDAGVVNEENDLPNANNVSESIFNEPSFSNDFNGAKQNEFANQSDFVQLQNDEIENVLDHADVFIEHGRTTLAIQLLQNHLEEAPTDSPVIWLKLLGLLAKEGSESDYESAVKECNQFFNIKMPGFADAMIPDFSTIEEHPHILTRLEGVWGSQYAVGFLNDLIYNQQSQPREGFERSTFEELYFLKKIAVILESSNTNTRSAYKPGLIKPALENVQMNREVFASAGLVGTPLQEKRTGADINSSYDVNQQYENTVIIPVQTPEAIPNVVEANTEEVKDAFSEPDDEKDIYLFTENNVSPHNAADVLDFEEIDFDLSLDETINDATNEVIAEEVIGVHVLTEGTELGSTDFEIEESDADIINKYLSRTEEKTKNKKKESSSESDDNMIEFDWNLPKIHKD